ncbi:MAG: Alpha/beta hydrolase family protein [Microgenomates bacterium OLB22]|nr:MAG: Alpha/beta hydrolase family protein [Microgenomates bacterium OLB22]
MKRTFLILILGFVVAMGAGMWLFSRHLRTLPTPVLIKEGPLMPYTIENLHETTFEGSTIVIDKELEKGPGFVSFSFHYQVPSKPEQKPTKKVSGMLTLPDKPGTYPIMVLFRGYVPVENYRTGVGTRKAAQAYAKNGFIAISPDFLGYGESEPPSENTIEARMQTYTSALTLLSSLSSLQETLAPYKQKPDLVHIGLWGHSNGGQIALTVLAVTQKAYPTVLWAPVTKPFPYSILYYTDDSDDEGRALRKVLAGFEQEHDARLFSWSQYYTDISAPIQLHQGTDDTAVPEKWSVDFVERMKEAKKDIIYFS